MNCINDLQNKKIKMKNRKYLKERCSENVIEIRDREKINP